MLAPKSILLHLDTSPSTEQRVQVAGRVAELFDAQVTALYCVTPALLRYPFALEGAATALSMMDEFDRECKNKAQEMFDRACAGSARLKWAESKNGPPWEFIRWSFYTDLIILGQHEGGHLLTDELPFDFLPTVVIDSGRPALILPYIGSSDSIGHTVLVAWKETREAARAVSAALPWLHRAKAVHVVSYEKESHLSLQTLNILLKAHGIVATLHQGGAESGNTGENLLSMTTTLGADLLVMGCYGHTRARQWMLGGVTRSILRSMTVPVLMVH